MYKGSTGKKVVKSAADSERYCIMMALASLDEVLASIQMYFLRPKQYNV